MEMYRLAIDRSPTITAVVDADLRCIASSRRWRRLFESEDEGLAAGGVHAHPRLASWEPRLRACLAGEDQLVEGDRLEGPEGPMGRVDWEAARLDGPSGVLGATVVICSMRHASPRTAEPDIRGERFDRQDLRGQKLAGLGLLAGCIAHDLNNMLMAVLGNASLALEHLPGGSDARAHVGRVERSAHHAAALCKKLLAYASQGAADVRSVDLGAEIAELAQLLEVSRPKNVRLEFECPRELPAVSADLGQLQQVIMNLALNASEAIGSAAGVVRVETGVERLEARDFADAVAGERGVAGEYVFLRIIDTGAGMDVDTQRRMFDPFFTTKRKGHGLGMAAVLEIVRGHGGVMKVASAPGRGTSITVYLPVSAARPPARAEAGGAALEWNGAGTALLIDDEPATREVVGMMLEEVGITAVPASEGDDAISLFETKPSRFDLVILDLHMPGRPPLETLRALRAIRPALPVLLTSGSEPPDEVKRAIRSPAMAFLQKPYRLVELRAAVKSLLRPDRVQRRAVRE